MRSIAKQMGVIGHCAAGRRWLALRLIVYEREPFRVLAVPRGHPVRVAAIHLPQAVVRVNVRNDARAGLHADAPRARSVAAQRQAVERSDVLLIDVRAAREAVGNRQGSELFRSGNFS